MDVPIKIMGLSCKLSNLSIEMEIPTAEFKDPDQSESQIVGKHEFPI